MAARGIKTPAMKTRGLFSWLAAGALTIACANGTTRSLDEEGTPKPAQTADPTDPSDPITLPPSQAGDDDDDTTDAGTADASDAGDAGKDASTTVDSGVDAGKDSGTPIVDAGGGCTTAAPSNACGVVPQCGCTATQTCDVTNLSTGAVSCVLAGGGPQGSYCTASNQCAKGTTCQGNACRPFCNNPGGTCATAGTGLCFAPQQSSGATTPNLNVCAITCDPRTPSAACGSNNCLWFSADKQSDCRSGGHGGPVRLVLDARRLQAGAHVRRPSVLRLRMREVVPDRRVTTAGSSTPAPTSTARTPPRAAA